MCTTDIHLRYVIEKAWLERSPDLVDAAFAIVDEHFDGFIEDPAKFSPELLVLFAEAASAVGNREKETIRALMLYDRGWGREEDQFTARALLVRCIYEARLGFTTCSLKGEHLLQQTRYALKFLSRALEITEKQQFGARYGFLVYNASLVFWDVARPLCRKGWQRHLAPTAKQVFDGLCRVMAAAPGGKGGGGSIPLPDVPDNTCWVVEVMLLLAFCLDDDGKGGEAAKLADDANGLLKAHPEVLTKFPWLEEKVLNARAYFSQGILKDLDGPIMRGRGTALAVRNMPLGADNATAEADLVKAWMDIDTRYALFSLRVISRVKLVR